MRASLLALLVVLSGCNQLAQQNAVDELRQDLNALESSLTASDEALRVLQAREQETDTSIMHQINNLNGSVADLSEIVAATCRQTLTTEAPPPAQCEETPRVVTNGDKMIVGGIERVWLDPPGIVVVARVDTGASSSSIHAANITEFERDGDDWVRFEMTSGDNTVEVERAVKRHVRVFQQADKDGSRRPVVEMRAQLGDVTDVFEFTLADRSHLEHGMILGRNFLTDVALVDVGQEFVQPSVAAPNTGG